MGIGRGGLVTADGFENLRSLVDPKRRRGEGRGRLARPRHAAGRWALVRHVSTSVTHEARSAAFADQLLARWGVLFRDLLARESLAPPWRACRLSCAARKHKEKSEAVALFRVLAASSSRAPRHWTCCEPAAEPVQTMPRSLRSPIPIRSTSPYHSARPAGEHFDAFRAWTAGPRDCSRRPILTINSAGELVVRTLRSDSPEVARALASCDCVLADSPWTDLPAPSPEFLIGILFLGLRTFEWDYTTRLVRALRSSERNATGPRDIQRAALDGGRLRGATLCSTL